METFKTSPSNSLVGLAAFVVVIAGMKTASPLVVPFLLASFLAIICAPPLFWMRRKGVPSLIAILLLLLLVVSIFFMVGTLVGSSLADFSSNVPSYQLRLKVFADEGYQWLVSHGFTLDRAILEETINPGKIMQLAANTLNGLGGLLTNTFFILLTFIFILTEAAGIPAKIGAIHGVSGEYLQRYGQILSGVNRYLGIKTSTSALTGLIIGFWLAFQGVDYAVMWGVLAFLLNFIPNIGSIIAAIPAVLLSLIQLGPGSAVVTGMAFLLVNVVIGSVLEPRIMGRDMGLSTLIVFLSLTFWGWVLGPVGMLLSVPLTMAIKIILDGNPETRWIAVILGSNREANERLNQE